MGNAWNKLFCKQEKKVLIMGLDTAGKTTILYKMKLGDVVRTIPTIGINVETLEFMNVTLIVWDIGCRDQLRSLWIHYYKNTDALVFVVDSSDSERLIEAADEFNKLIKEEELRDVSILVLANKQDHIGSCGINEIAETFKLDQVKQNCNIFGTSACDGTGLIEAFQWLVISVEQRHSHTDIRPAQQENAKSTWKQNAVQSYGLDSLKKWFHSVLRR